MSDHVPLAPGWALWRDFAVRSAGFPVAGLEVFGPGDEAGRLRALAGDARFREAMTWQNPAAVANALDRLDSPAPGNRVRRREETVASYWQRYCAKNDTIGFFGPLAWGRIADGGPPLTARSGPLIGRRDVRLEAWGVQAVAAKHGLRVPTGIGVEDGLAGEDFDRLRAARDAVAAAAPEDLGAALAALDGVFTELTGQAATRNHGRAYGARTLAYVDCLRDLDVTVGPGFLAEIAPVAQLVFEAGRWYSGRVQAVVDGVVAAAHPGKGPLGPLLGRVLPALFALPPELEDEAAELQRRVAALLADPDPATLGARAQAAFADHRPAWSFGVHQSLDLQVADGPVAVVGDVHPGDNPLGQALFGARFPGDFAAAFAADVDRPFVKLLPPLGPGLGVDARGAAVVGDIDIALDPGVVSPTGTTWFAGDLLVDGDEVVHPEGRAALRDVFGLPAFIAGVRTFDLFGDAAHAPRLTVGRTVLRRESWTVPAGEDHEALGLPRRVFFKSPVERKPVYLDRESPVLNRIVRRQIRQAGAAPVRFTEMLPTPEQCWLRDEEGRRCCSELRLVGVAAP